MKVKIYGAERCKYCKQAKKICVIRGIDFEYIDVEAVPEAKAYIKEELNAKTIPQIIVDGKLVGGFNEFTKLL